MTFSANAMEETPAADELDPTGGPIFNLYRRTQVMVLIASVLGILMFWSVGRWLGIPAERGFTGSLLQQPNGILNILCVYVLIAAGTILGAVIAGRWWFFAGLFAGTISLAALSVRSGPMHFVVFAAEGAGGIHGGFVRLLIEQCLLFAPIALIWAFFWRRYEAAIAGADVPVRPDAVPLGAAIVAQIALTGALVWFLSPTDAKKQVLIGVFIAGLVGAALADYIVPNRKAARWFWAGPFVVGAIGYVLACYNASSWMSGSSTAAWSALARPLPLDYAGAGSAGALLGYWIAAERLRVSFFAKPTAPPPAAKSEIQSANDG